MGESLDGQVALVTGGARRLGAAIVRRLHAAGARVALHYRGSETEAEELEAELEAVRAGSAARVRRDLITQGEHITENLARQSVLALLTASPENAAEAVRATLSFPGARLVEIRDSYGKQLLRNGKDFDGLRGCHATRAA